MLEAALLDPVIALEFDIADHFGFGSALSYDDDLLLSIVEAPSPRPASVDR